MTSHQHNPVSEESGQPRRRETSMTSLTRRMAMTAALALPLATQAAADEAIL